MDFDADKTSYSVAEQNSRKAGFTLAEVLITLGIIGVIAAITMPTLIQKHNDRVTITKLKKFMSVMNSAITMVINENGPIESWDLVASDYDEETGSSPESTAGKDAFIKKYILPYVKYSSYCMYGDSTCKKYDRYSLDGTRFSSWVNRIVLADGSVLTGAYINYADCAGHVGKSKQLQNVCGQFFYDVNGGGHPPNKTGEDVFVFWFTKYGVVPLGTQAETAYSFKNFCNMSVKAPLNGYGCAAWVIYNENMDYKYCNDLSWDGKKTCK